MGSIDAVLSHEIGFKQAKLQDTVKDLMKYKYSETVHYNDVFHLWKSKKKNFLNMLLK